MAHGHGPKSQAWRMRDMDVLPEPPAFNALALVLLGFLGLVVALQFGALMLRYPVIPAAIALSLVFGISMAVRLVRRIEQRLIEQDRRDQTPHEVIELRKPRRPIAYRLAGGFIEIDQPQQPSPKISMIPPMTLEPPAVRLQLAEHS